MKIDFSEFEKIVEVAISSRKGSLTQDSIRSVVEEYGDIFGTIKQEREKLIRKIESKHDVTMPVSAILQEANHEKWLDSERSNIEYYYWDRYKEFLKSTNGLPSEVIYTLDKDTDRILDLSGNPKNTELWDRRGMVIGHVQSGKTGNYTGLICKAADAGYRVIIVITGIHNVLREQTQKRLDEGFLGYDSTSISNKKVIGAGKFNSNRIPASLTTTYKDFDKSKLEVNIPIKNLKEPILFVIKKNHNTLRNLISWFNKQKSDIGMASFSEPMLLIDDEADNASINIKHDKDEISKINGQIRQLLNTFSRSCYVGYTATPFANIFISPNSDDQMIGHDLFPKDFIVSLNTPSNYVGASKIFDYVDSDESGKGIVKHITDNMDLLPSKHQKDFRIVELPGSLKKAVGTFIVAQAIRRCKGHQREHCSMLVNVSRFVSVQESLYFRIREFLEPIEHAINVFSFMSEEKALKNKEIKFLHEIYKGEYGNIGNTTWSSIQSELKYVIDRMKVKTINSKSPDALDYAESVSPVSLIAVGGMSLSRGLTLEGLTVSYFSRNSIMYDTLMQMARWFGYRDDYDDLCRIWMTEETEGWYMHISESIEELRDEIRHMEAHNATPREFGLKVRTHPGSLMITARNKLGSGKTFSWNFDLGSQRVETWILYRDEETRLKNYKVAQRLANKVLESKNAEEVNNKGGKFFSDVPVATIIEFLRYYKNNPASSLTEIDPILEYIGGQVAGELAYWDVYFPSLKARDENSMIDNGMGFEIICQKRTAGDFSDVNQASELYVGRNWRVSSRGIDKIGLSYEEIEKVENHFKKGDEQIKNFPDNIYNEVRRKPLLAVHLLSMRKEKNKFGKENLINAEPYVAWGISFPASTGENRQVEYRVNTTWIQQYLFDEISDSEESEDE